MVSGGGPYEVHLIAYGDRASSSAIAHEHLHWALDQATGDNDYYHRSMDWAAVGELEDSLVAAGL